MEKLAALVVRFGQIHVEFGEDVVLRAIHAASVAAAQVILAEAEAQAEARARPVLTAQIIAFPPVERDRSDPNQEPKI